MHQIFKSAVLSQRPTVFGKKLNPLTLGHCAILDAEGNCFISGGDATLNDLVFGVLVCANQFDDFYHYRDNKLEELCKESKKMGEKYHHYDVEKEAEKFAAYIKDQTTLPKRFGQDESSSQTYAPWWLMAAYKLCGGFPFCQNKFASVMNTPVAMALSMYLVDSVAHGDTSWFSEEVEELIKKHEEESGRDS